jgi:hypothetical protein
VRSVSSGRIVVSEQLWSKELERELLLTRILSDGELVCVASEAGLTKYSNLCEEGSKKSIYVSDDVKRNIIKECIKNVNDERLVEAFKKVKPRIYPEEIPFRGNYYTYFGDGNLQLKGSWGDVKKDVYEVLREGGERVYAFLKALIELTEEIMKRYDVRYCYIFGPDYGSILRKMREILGRFEALTPRDFLILKAARIYYKSGSHRNPTHSIPLEIIPAVKEVLEGWERSKGIKYY